MHMATKHSNSRSIASMYGVVLALLSVTLTAPYAVAFERVTVPLDFGWRWSKAETLTPSQCDFPVIINGSIGGTGFFSPSGSVSPEACEAAACSTGTQAWSFCTGHSCDYRYNGVPANYNGSVCVLGSPGQIIPSRLTNNKVIFTKSQNLTKGPDADSVEAQPNFVDTHWQLVDIPHDASIANGYSPIADAGEGFIPSVRSWYRKHLAPFPSEWRGMPIHVVVDGALASSSWWINGNQVLNWKTDSYLPTTLRIDNIPNLKLVYDDSETDESNLISIYTTNAASTGWWYEGSGLVRHARLIVTPPTSLEPAFAVAAPAIVSDMVTTRASVAEGQTANAMVSPRSDVVAHAPTTVSITHTLLDADGKEVGESVNHNVSLKGGAETVQGNPIQVKDAELWSVQRPYQYTVVTRLTHGDDVDVVNITIGIRSLDWSPKDGLHINGDLMKMRGFCNHENFAGVGAALPPRIDLFRVQQLRGVGGNAWRTSHNPPESNLLEVTDRLGVVVLDENRVLSTQYNCAYDPITGASDCKYVPAYESTTQPDARFGMYSGIAAEAGKLALRDRNHASVVFFSLCNEMGCSDGTLLVNDTAQGCYNAIMAADGSRAVTGNQAWQGINAVAPGTPIANMYDVMGMSHQGPEQLEIWHKGAPNKLVIMTECCSCETQRGEDADMFHPDYVNATVWESNENSACLTEQVGWSDLKEWVGGTFVWTLHDYIGEPDRGQWPHVSSSFGSFDLSGFPKAPAWWYRSRWLANISTEDAGRPSLKTEIKTDAFVRIVESWQPNPKNPFRTINVYSNAPFVRLLINGVSINRTTFLNSNGAAVFPNIRYVAGNITAEAVSEEKVGSTVLATHTTHSWGKAERVVLSLDVPSIRTGTGTAVFLDGEDVALVRATVVDADGNVVRNSNATIHIHVASGPASLVGVNNGDPAYRGPPNGNGDFKSGDVPAYHGLARAIFKVNVKQSGTVLQRTLEKLINKEAGMAHNSSSSQIDLTDTPYHSFTVVATMQSDDDSDIQQTQTAELMIPLSVDANDSPLNVASRSVSLADVGE